MPTPSKGFTLIELLVAVTIIAVLATIGLRTFKDTQENAQDQQRVQNMNSIREALELYRNDKRSYPKDWNELVTGNYLKSIPKDPAGRDYQYRAFPDPACTSANRTCSAYVICATKEGTKTYDVPTSCAALSCNGTAGDCDIGLSGGEATTIVIPPSPTPTTIPFPSTGLIAYWKMDETAGSTIADSRGVYTGTVNLFIPISPGRFGNSRSFTSQDVSVMSISPNLTKSGWTGITQSAWVNVISPGNVNGFPRIIANGEYHPINGGTTLELGLFSTTGRLAVFRRDSVGVLTDTVSAVGQGWIHIAYTSDGVTTRLYKNGALIGTSTTPHAINSSVPMFVGNSVDTRCCEFDGRIDEVGVWNRVLDAAEIQNLFLGARP